MYIDKNANATHFSTTYRKIQGFGLLFRKHNTIDVPQTMIYPTSTTSPDSLILPPHDDDGRAGLQNEGWWDDSSLLRAGAAEAAVPPSNAAESLHHTAAVAAEAASPLDDFLSGEHHDKYPFGFTISIPKNEHKISFPAAMASEYEQKNGEEEEGSCDCDESASLVSELTQMTYRAELKKQVSSEMIFIMCMRFDLFTTAANFLSFSSSMMMQAIMIEFEKFRQQKRQQGVEAHPEVIKTMFHRTMSCPDIQKNMTSFVNSTSAKMKAEARQHHLLEEEEEEEEEEHDATSDPTIQRRVDELFVEFGVRPERPILQHAYEISEENDVGSRPSTEQGVATDHHLDSVIQLKLQLAQKQATLDELSSKYNALLVQKSAHQHNMVAENSRLMRENEWLRAQLRQAGITTSAAPTGHQLTSSSCDVAGSRQDRLTPPSPSQPSHTFNIHKLLQDRLTSAREVDTKKVDASNKAYQTRPKLREFKSFGTTSTATDTSLDTNESPPLQVSPKPLNSFSNLIQGWRNTSRRRRGNGKEWTSALMLQRPPAA